MEIEYTGELDFVFVFHEKVLPASGSKIRKSPDYATRE
jgi:hypothetical protein